MGPLITQGIISPEWNPMIAFIVGLGFGFALEQAGFSSSRKLIGIFYGYDMIVVRVFLTAVLTASVGLLFFNYLGWIDYDLVFVNPTFLWSAIIGGAFVGLGIIMSGFCPGTSFSALSIGKIDALAFIIGIGIGVFFYAETFELLFEKLYYAQNLGGIRIYETFGISPGLFMFLFILFGLGIFWFTIFIKKKYSNRNLKY
ncbi:MAG: YeeE/YedE family protein [Bacteroidales bacterium]|nr:YeeE/YedE family protein [Bacteroidales bacterium]